MPLEGEGKRLPSIAKGWEASCPNLLPALLPLSPQRLRICSVSEKNSSRNCPINQQKPQMGSHKAARRCDRGFADAVLVTEADIGVRVSYVWGGGGGGGGGGRGAGACRR